MDDRWMVQLLFESIASGPAGPGFHNRFVGRGDAPRRANKSKIFNTGKIVVRSLQARESNQLFLALVLSLLYIGMEL
jgi:hypothetical protein